MSQIEPVAKRLVLDELRRTLDAQFGNADDLDNKLKTLLSSASLILSLVTTLQITTGIDQISWLYLVGLVAVLALYIFLIVAVARGLRPMTYQAPIPSKQSDIEEHYYGQDEDFALETLILTYLDALDKNEAPINYKADMVARALKLLVFIVFALILLGIVGFSGNTTFPWDSPLPTP